MLLAPVHLQWKTKQYESELNVITAFSLLQRIGYLAAAQSFHDSTDVLMLTTNMIRKVEI